MNHPKPALQRILVVDDDAAILRLVGDRLDQEGFSVHTTLSGQEALDAIERYGLPHLALVDITMPGMDGFEFCHIVQQFSDFPVIMLTAVDEEETIIRGIEHFAEDYVTKPFSPGELVARIRRVLRRIGDYAYAQEPVIVVDPHLGVSFVQQMVIVDGEQVPLTPTQTKLLYILMRNAGRTVTNDFILRRLWPRDDVYEDALRVHIHHLRAKLKGSTGREWIITERGTGYRFADQK